LTFIYDLLDIAMVVAPIYGVKPLAPAFPHSGREFGSEGVARGCAWNLAKVPELDSDKFTLVKLAPVFTALRRDVHRGGTLGDLERVPTVTGVSTNGLIF
jgi:hypothetical protein